MRIKINNVDITRECILIILGIVLSIVAALL